MTRPVEIGFYGKVRTRGDFVGRGLSRSFVGVWDEWVQRGMLAARERLGDAWLASYLVMPLWCFALEGGVVDDYGYAGVMVPSLDAVGRYFPFVIAIRTAPDAAARWRVGGSAWYRQAASLALSTLGDSFTLSRLEADIKAFSEKHEDVWPLGVRSDIGSNWWTLQDDPASPPVRSGTLDSALFTRLLGR
ncbi:type VI secretion system-associated protein TagF [Paraburkholderia sp. RL18-103-BIB-C]|jgi:type VI secretion system protein ImpM|uniref:type VI secretion system-associated protein TagF n=1 Tax=unclassified Paraburkholderia TaxID=2615204 RepID=UPI0038BCE761